MITDTNESFTVRQLVIFALYITNNWVQPQMLEPTIRLYEGMLRNFSLSEIQKAIFYHIDFFETMPFPDQIIDAINRKIIRSPDTGRILRH